jgi:exosortase
MLDASLVNGYGSYIFLIPLFSGYLIWSHRAEIFREPRFAPKTACAIFPSALFTLWMSTQSLLVRSNPLLNIELRILGAILLVQAGFICCYGGRTFRRCLFPMLLLVTAVPIPPTFANALIVGLQKSSAALSYLLFSLLGIPALREGVVIAIPGVTIEVAKECSGINSSVALLLTILFVAYEGLRSPWRRAVLILFAIPLSIAKNVVRIVTLTLLAVYVDRSFLTGNLHHRGGIVFYLMTLATLYPVFLLLRNSERQEALSLQPTNGFQVSKVLPRLSVNQ